MAFTIALILCSTCFITSDAFQPTVMVASSISGKHSSESGNSSKNKNSQLNYAVYGGDQATAKNSGIKKSKKTIVKTIKSNSNTKNDNHGYVVANHDNERSFWLHALQNLESSSTSSESNQSLWTRIAQAYAPTELLSACSSIQEQQDATVVRVGDTDLDIAMPIPSDSWDSSILEEENVVSASKETRTNRHLVTVRVEFPEGSAFDKNAYTFEDELIAVIEQVRLLEQTANDRLEKSQ